MQNGKKVLKKEELLEPISLVADMLDFWSHKWHEWDGFECKHKALLTFICHLFLVCLNAGSSSFQGISLTLNNRVVKRPLNTIKPAFRLISTKMDTWEPAADSSNHLSSFLIQYPICSGELQDITICTNWYGTAHIKICPSLLPLNQDVLRQNPPGAFLYWKDGKGGGACKSQQHRMVQSCGTHRACLQFFLQQLEYFPTAIVSYETLPPTAT